ncbi:MAG: type I restriction endonuclease subunit R [Caldilineaceae bacterium]|nr:type I restriction endonuclease subunit R [Caldilineaceae bacterium]
MTSNFKLPPSNFSEDTLAQQTTADYLHDQLGWESVYAFDAEGFGPDSLLGRSSRREVVLTRYLGQALRKLNPGLPDGAYDDAIAQITAVSVSQSPVAINQEKHNLIRDGVQVQYRTDEGELEQSRLRVLDFDTPTNNHFLAVRELWIQGAFKQGRPDIVGFVNGLPLLFIELKNINIEVRQAYEKNLTDYKAYIPHLFHHNAFLILSNGDDGRLGTLTSRWEHFHQWKRLAEDEPGVVEMETLLKGVCTRANFLDLFENFIAFDNSAGETVKILARNHQYLGVNRAVRSVEERREREGKLGVFWHTQGSGKSYSMLFFARKIHRKLGGNFTFLVLTDRDDLDTQIYKTFAGCGLVNNDREPCRAASGDHLRTLLRQQNRYVFSLIQKFSQDVSPEAPYSRRDDIIVMSDEAHRTQYGRLSLNMRNALPQASYIGFTGTPLFKDDQLTRRVFGDYVSTYDFQRAVVDNATVPLYYDARGEKLGIATNDLNERIAAKLEELEIDDIDVTQRLESEMRRDYHLITAENRLDAIVADFVAHYSTAWETGKAMFICIDKITCVRMYDKIEAAWAQRISQLEQEITGVKDEQEEVYRKRQIAWMRETEMAVIISDEQGEVGKFAKWGLDIAPHRRLIREGYVEQDGRRLDVEDAFKKREHPFRVAIVCAMWLTGFDVKSLANLYLDKPLKAHSLMQAIARANRVDEGKNNGLIIDYCGILRNLREALATFAGHVGGELIDGEPEPQVDPARPAEELLAELEEAVAAVTHLVLELGANLDDIRRQSGFARNRAIVDVKEAINYSDETRKRFEIMARAVFAKFKACLTQTDVNVYRHDYDVINIVYRSLKGDVDAADISAVIRELHGLVDEVVTVRPAPIAEGRAPFDISRIDFDSLRTEFEKSKTKNTGVQSLKALIEKRLEQMLRQNPMRTDFQRYYEEIVERYNHEKDRVTIEQTFEELLNFMESLNDEKGRAMREGLDEDFAGSIRYSLCKTRVLSQEDIVRIKQVASELLVTLQKELDRVQAWWERSFSQNHIRVTIHDFLYSDLTGLPSSYSEEEIQTKAKAVYAYLFSGYQTRQSAA